MNSIFDKDKKYKEAIGAFILTFSELEYGLADLSSWTVYDLTKRDTHWLEHIGYPFEKKVKNLTEYINANLSELKPVWDKLKVEIGQLNSERRFIAHGFNQSFLPNETTKTFIKEGRNISTRKLDIKTINNLTQQLRELNTGENGINGEFHIQFMKMRIDKWNELVNDNFKIIYRVNNKIESNWTGINK